MSQRSNRYRGILLTPLGVRRLEESISLAQDQEKFGSRFTQAELSDRANLSIKTIKKIREGKVPTDDTSVRALFSAFGLELETADYGQPEPSPSTTDAHPPSSYLSSTPKIDWGEKPDTTLFFGRTAELATLNQWVQGDQCRLITLLGMGGIGKTSLAAKLANQVYDRFDYVIWRSLREAPPLDEILVRLIQFLSDQQETEINLPTRLGERIIRLLHYLREHRCLVVLDNLESILQAETAGHYRDGYEGYGELIQRIGSTEHQSCLLLTSRECPRELAPLAGELTPVRLWSVGSIDTEAGREILKTKGLALDEADDQGQELIRRCSGNPQALHLVATAIQREFLGDVDDFLQEQVTAVEDVRSLLDQHLSRLAPLERSVLFWLAINREPVGLDELMEDLLPPVTKQEVRGALRGLSDRYLIETVGKKFTLQNVIMEFATDRFIEQVYYELQSERFELFHTHALMKAIAQDYVRETQIRLILKPISERISNFEEKIDEYLKNIRINSNWTQGYAAGNLINLLCQDQSKILCLNFSNLTLRQVYIEGIQLHKLNLANATFVNPSLTHTFGRIYSVALHSDTGTMATGDSNGQIRLSHIRNPQNSFILEGHSDLISSVSFRPDGHWLATGSGDTTIRLWDLQKRQCIHTLTGHTDAIWSVDFNPDGNLLISGGGDATIRLWDVQKLQCIHSFRDDDTIKGKIWAVSFSSNGELFASGGDDSKLRIWNIQKRRCIHTFTGHSDTIRSIAFSPDGKWLASGSGDHTICLWDVQKCQCVHKFFGHTDLVRSLTFTPDSRWLASGSGDHAIRLWDIRQRECIHTFIGHRNWVLSVTFSSDGRWLATSSEDATIRLWDVQKRQCFYTLTGHTNRVRSITFSPNGKWIATGGEDSIVRLWDVKKHQCIHTFAGHKNWIWSTVFSPCNQWLLSSGGDETIRLWDIENNQCIHVFRDQRNLVTSMAFSPNGKYIVAGGRKSTLKLWDIQTRQCIHSFTGHNNWVRAVAFSPDGQLIAAGGRDATIRLWNIQNLQCIHTFRDHSDPILSVAFSPDGKWLASSSKDNTIRLWSIQEKTCIHEFSGHNKLVWLVSFSPDSQRLASSSGDTVRLWDIQEKTCMQMFPIHGGWIRSVVFSPDGQTLASGSNDGTIRLWDVSTGECTAIFQAPRPYEETNITGVQGLSEAQRTSMLALGAVDYSMLSNQDFTST